MNQPKQTVKKPKISKTAVGRDADGGGLLNRSMPESLAAEAAVLGSMIVDPECIGLVVEKIRAEAFYRIEHQIIFESLIRLYEKNKGDGLDAVLLRDELEKHKQLEEVGGVDYIGRIIESVPSSANVLYYTDIIKNKQLLREIIQATTEILEDAYDATGEVSEKLDIAEQKIFSVTNKKMTGVASPLKDLVVRSFEMIEKRDGTLVTGLATGYHELDDLTCGLQKGEMIIVAGRPSMGKTSFVLNIAENVGVNDKTPIAI
ncbi:MAG TPA: DnaB-like helicase N-terminal domain-containing protein, partial [Sedimentisphaerales bacterium]|nr:DnaB-like helicase N-terminal domain-containing protein [Sedimentisphaerales bacterium]